VIYFEEWNNPYVCGVQWVTEIIDIAGGRDCFAHRSHPKKYAERRVSTEEITEAAPEIILASWCGNPVDVESFKKRPGWESVPAVKTGTIYEVPGEMILQPGPGLVKGARFIRDIIDKNAK
jgi:iron complex transport system substrate-binding protein